jgi:hypothetical protein
MQCVCDNGYTATQDTRHVWVCLVSHWRPRVPFRQLPTTPGPDLSRAEPIIGGLDSVQMLPIMSRSVPVATFTLGGYLDTQTMRSIAVVSIQPSTSGTSFLNVP